MISHIVVFKPRDDLSTADGESLAAAFARALNEIPDIRSVRAGRRVSDSREFLVALDFDDRAGLDRYLQHPAHQELAQRFWQSLVVSFSADFELAPLSASDLRTFFFDVKM